jgi:transcriptional regulator with XRE-family HTH domain
MRCGRGKLDFMRPQEKIRVWRERRGLTQEQLAAAVGHLQSRVGKWEKADTLRIEPRFLLRLARALEVPVEFLCDDALDEPSPGPPAGAPGTPPPPPGVAPEKYRLVLQCVEILGPDAVLARVLRNAPAAEQPAPDRPALPGPKSKP